MTNRTFTRRAIALTIGGMAWAASLGAIASEAHSSYRVPPAYTTTIGAESSVGIPLGVCPYGISDYDTRRHGRSTGDRILAHDFTSRRVFNLSPHRVRLFVWCG